MSDHLQSDANAEGLAQLRTELDQIDQQIHHLLIQRTSIVKQVAAAKGNAPIFRPAREAQILRNLIKMHQGPMPVAFVLDMWRDMLRGMSYLQRPLKITAYAPDDDLRYYHLARDYFGQNIPLKPGRSLMHTLSGIGMGSDMVVMPTPQQGEDTPWWSKVSASGPQRLYVIAQLPFYPHLRNEAHNDVAAFVLGCTPADPSGEDHSLFLIDCSRDIPRARLNRILSDKGLKILDWHSCPAHYDPDITRNLILIEGYYNDETAEIAALRLETEGQIDMIQYFGNYPVALSVEAR